MTKISWTTQTWNPVTGCSKVSPGCLHCYAETLSLARGWSQQPWAERFAAENVVLHPERLTQPLGWRKPRRVFVNSMSDLFHAQIPDEYLDRVFAVMALTSQHTYQVLTKRPERMRAYLSDAVVHDRVQNVISAMVHGDAPLSRAVVDTIARREQGWRVLCPWPLPNVWLGVSAEDQERADERIPLLLDTPAAVRFVSAEPLLGPIDFRDVMVHARVDALLADRPPPAPREAWARGIDWVIVGGESGPGFRAMEMAWARSIRDQCAAAGVAYFYKQASAYRTETRPWLVEEDGSRWRWHQYPDDPAPPERLD